MCFFRANAPCFAVFMPSYSLPKVDPRDPDRPSRIPALLSSVQHSMVYLCLRYLCVQYVTVCGYFFRFTIWYISFQPTSLLFHLVVRWVPSPVSALSALTLKVG